MPSAAPDAARPRGSWRAGFRAGLPYGGAGFVIAIAFGALAREAGMPTAAVVAMSAIVWAGAGQFAAISVLAAGGGLVAAVAAATLVTSRYLPMGIALAPSLRGGPLARAARGQAVIDTSWVIAARGDGRFDVSFLLGASALQYLTWVGGTVVGVLAGDALGDIKALGLDAALPTFFVAMLLGELRRRGAVAPAVLGALIGVALLPVAPPGVPVLAASVAALAGLAGGTAA